MVPTANTERFSFLLETNLGAGRPTFLAGASGAGKTMLAAQVSPYRNAQDAKLLNLFLLSRSLEWSQVKRIVAEAKAVGLPAMRRRFLAAQIPNNCWKLDDVGLPRYFVPNVVHSSLARGLVSSV